MITILGPRAQIGDYFFFSVPIEAAETRFLSYLNATISTQDSLLWYKNLPIENALQGLKLG